MAGKFRSQPAHRQRAARAENPPPSDNWGWRWAAIAAESGTAVAACEPLPEPEEALARRFAQSSRHASPEVQAMASAQAEALANGAVTSYRAALPIVRAMESPDCRDEQLRAAAGAISTTMHWGRLAARAHRTLALLAELEGAQ